MVGNEEEREYSAGASVPEGHAAGWRRVSWGAVFAGAFVTMAVFLTLQMLGAGIGASSIDLTGNRVTSARSLGIGAAIWWFITGLISLFIGGWVAGRLGWRANKTDRALHGLTVWSVFYVAMFLLAATALSALVGGGISLLGSGVSAAGQAAGTPQGQQAIQRTLESWGLSPQIIQDQITQALGGTSQQNPQANKDVATAVNDYLNSPRTPQDRQRVVQTITQSTGMSEAQANQMISNIERTAEQAKATGEQAANITGWTFIGLAISMIIGAIVAALGSLAATAPVVYVPSRVREREVVGTTEGRDYSARR
jgi:hypothetical protein